MLFVSNIPVKDSLQKKRKKIRKKLPVTKIGKKELFENRSGYTNFDKDAGVWSSPGTEPLDDIFPVRRPTWQMGLSVLRGRIDEEEGKNVTPIKSTETTALEHIDFENMIKSGTEEGTHFKTMIIVQDQTLTHNMKMKYFDCSKYDSGPKST